MKINTQKKTIKKLLSVALTVSIIATSFASVVQASAQTVANSTNKTKEFVISHKDEFSVFMNTPSFWESNYKITLDQDIDMQGETFKSIEKFSGVFDGRGHTVSNLKIQNKRKTSKAFEIALIKTLEHGAEFKNVTFDNYIVKDTGSSVIISSAGRAAGLFLTNHGNISDVNIKNGIINNVSARSKPAGFVFNNSEDGTIENCSIQMSSEKSRIRSGFVGTNLGEIKNSSTNISVDYGKITHDDFQFSYGYEYDGKIDWYVESINCNELFSTGGFCAKNLGNILSCHSKGSVRVDSTSAYTICGGFVGDNNGAIQDCDSKGAVNGEEYVGGFCGVNRDNGNILYSNSYGNANAKTQKHDNHCGGFIGRNTGFVTKCRSTGTSTGEEYVGGFCGENIGKISNSNSSGNATASTKKHINHCGGFVGINENGTISDCISVGSVIGQEYVGGFVGINTTFMSKITSCTASGKAIAKTKINTACAGGFVGENEQGEITSCTATGGADARSNSGPAKAGGFVGVNGFVDDGIEKGSIMNSKASGSIYLSSGTFHTDNGCGGFVGKNNKGGKIDGCYAECTVETTNHNKGSGFIGEAENKSEIYNSSCKTKRIIKNGKTKKAGFCYDKSKKAVIKNCHAY
ncbi:MAG: hypothetical protein K2G97_01555 [Oscillospiraceae bacterium]|nr:hypothetical protein [Oscillospiraceae bacterium]